MNIDPLMKLDPILFDKLEKELHIKAKEKLQDLYEDPKSMTLMFPNLATIIGVLGSIIISIIAITKMDYPIVFFGVSMLVFLIIVNAMEFSHLKKEIFLRKLLTIATMKLISQETKVEKCDEIMIMVGEALKDIPKKEVTDGN
jgi:hypothetical protein